MKLVKAPRPVTCTPAAPKEKLKSMLLEFQATYSIQPPISNAVQYTFDLNPVRPRAAPSLQRCSWGGIPAKLNRGQANRLMHSDAYVWAWARAWACSEVLHENRFVEGHVAKRHNQKSHEVKFI